MTNNNLSLEELIAKIVPILKTVNLPSEQYKSKFCSLLRACLVNDSNLKISALRAVLEVEYKHIKGKEISALKNTIDNDATLNKYIKAIHLDINEESRFGVHAKGREPDEELVECLVHVFFMYLYSTYNNHVSGVDFSFINATMDNQSINKVEQEINEMSSVNSAPILALILNTVNPYLNKMPNLEKLINDELADSNSFLNSIYGKKMHSLMFVKVPK